jgi:hypothetical protein
MNKNHTYRMTVTVPKYIKDRLTEVPNGGVSQLVTKALENYFSKEPMTSADAAARFLELGRKAKPMTAEQIKKAIERGRA